MAAGHEIPSGVVIVGDAKTLLAFSGTQFTLKALNNRRINTVEMTQLKMPVYIHSKEYIPDSKYSTEGDHLVHIIPLADLHESERRLLEHFGVNDWERYEKYLEKLLEEQREWYLRGPRRFAALKHPFNILPGGFVQPSLIS